MSKFPGRPKSSRQQDIDQLGVRIFGLKMAALGWKETPKTLDFGIDGSVAIFENRENIGLEFSYQLKSKSAIKFNKDGSLSCSGIEKTTAALFKESNAHPLLIVVDVKTGSVYWDFAHSSVVRWEKATAGKNTKTKTITLKLAPRTFDADGVKLLIDILQRINADTPRPLEFPPGIILVKLDPKADAVDIRDELQDAVDIANSGRYERAAEKGLALLARAALVTDRIRVLKVLTKCAFERGITDEAIKYAKSGFELGDLGLGANLLGILAKNEQLPEAESLLESMSPATRGSANIISAEALIKLVAGDLDSALKLYEKAYGLNPKLDEAKLNAAFIHRDKGNLTEERTLLKEILAGDPGNPNVKVAYANTLLMEGQAKRTSDLMPEAERIFSEVLQHFKARPAVEGIHKEAHAMASMGLCVVETSRGNYAKGTEYLREVLAAGLRWPTLYYNLAQGEMATNSSKEARANYIRALRAPADDSVTSRTGIVDYWRGLAQANLNIFFDTKDRRFSNKAIWAYKIVLKKDPDSPAFVNLGIALLASGRTSEAIVLADKMTGKIGSHYLKAQCYEAAGERDKMLAELEKELKLDPEEFQVHMAIGHCWFDKGNAKKALEYYTHAFNSHNWFQHAAAPLLVNRMIRCYAGLKTTKDALELYDKIPDFLKNNPEVAKALNLVLKK